MATTEHEIQVGSAALPVTVARAGGAGAAVLFVPSAYGLAPDVRGQLEALAADAAFVCAPDLSFRAGGGVVPYSDIPAVMARLGTFDRERAVLDLIALIAWMRAEGAARIVFVGVCYAGAFGFRLAAEGLVDAVVTWHAGRLEQHLDLVPRLRVPIRMHFGGADPVVPPSAVDAVRAAFAGHPDAEVVVHPGASHGFTHPGAAPYDPNAERAAMAAVRALV